MYLNGLAVYLDESMVDKVWVFPQHRFFSYEPKDEGWCRRLGIGYEKTVPKPEAYQIGNKLVMHPTLWEELKKQTKKIESVMDSRLRKIQEKIADEIWNWNEKYLFQPMKQSFFSTSMVF